MPGTVFAVIRGLGCFRGGGGPPVGMAAVLALLLGMAERLVGPADSDKLLRCAGIRISVGVVFKHQPPVGCFDGLGRGTAFKAEDVVVVAHGQGAKNSGFSELQIHKTIRFGIILSGAKFRMSATSHPEHLR